MRIGQFSDTFLPVVDGVGRVVSHYARELGRLGEDCFVITPRQDLKEREEDYTIVNFSSLKVPGIPVYRFGLPGLSLAYRKAIGGIELDIVHAHSPFFAGREALRIARKRKIPLVGTFHSKYYDDLYQITHSKALARLGLKYIVGFYERCDAVWTVSEGAADVLRSYGYKGPIEVVRNGTDPSEADPAAIAEVSARFHLQDGPVLLYAGQLNWKKNIRRILEAADVLKKQGRTFQVVLAGQGPSERAIRALSSALGLDGNIVYTGHISDQELLKGLYARADLFFFPSLYDTAGLVVAEAAAVGTPSLLAEGSSAAGAITDGFNGLLAEDTAEAMAIRVAWALDHPEELAAIGRSARDTLPKPWSEVLHDVVKRYERLILGF